MYIINQLLRSVCHLVNHLNCGSLSRDQNHWSSYHHSYPLSTMHTLWTYKANAIPIKPSQTNNSNRMGELWDDLTIYVDVGYRCCSVRMYTQREYRLINTLRQTHSSAQTSRLFGVSINRFQIHTHI